MKQLYNKETEQLHPWPAGDADHVVGLDPVYEELDVIQEPIPEVVPAGYSLRPTQVVDVEAKTATHGFELVAIELPIPTPTLRSFRRACGKPLWQRVEAAVQSMTDEGEKWDAEQFLEYSPTVARNHPLVLQLAESLGLDDEEVDAVFIAAQALDAAS